MVIPCSRRELEVVKKALSCILQEENPLPEDQRCEREGEISRRIHGVVDHGHHGVDHDLNFIHVSFDDSNSERHGTGGGLNPIDMQIMSRLLQQVCILERGKDKLYLA